MQKKEILLEYSHNIKLLRDKNLWTKVKNCAKNAEPSAEWYCQEINFYEPLEMGGIEEKVLKPNNTERVEEVVLSPEIFAQNKVENCNVKAV